MKYSQKHILVYDLKRYIIYLSIPYTLNSAYNKKKYVKILLHYRQLFIKGNVFIGVCSIFGADIFLCYSQFFIKGNFIIGRVE